jgi:hypothetical protein
LNVPNRTPPSTTAADRTKTATNEITISSAVLAFISRFVFMVMASSGNLPNDRFSQGRFLSTRTDTQNKASVEKVSTQME